MSIQGLTRIELTDTRTGRTRVWEHKNRVTGALQQIFTPFGLYTDAAILEPQGSADANSLLQYACGGLLLLDTAIGAGDTLLPAAGTGVTGAAAYNLTNSGDNRVRGSYNAVESELDPDGGLMKFVYDFSTQQANGTIASVCLSHRAGGLLAAEDTHAGNTYYNYERGEGFGGRLSGGFFTFLDAAGDLPYLLEMDEEADELLLARPAAAGTALALTLEAYPAYTRGLDLFWQRGANKPLLKRSETVTVQPALLQSGGGTAYFLGWNYRPENRTLYITNTAGSEVAANDAFQVLALDLATKQVTAHSLTNQTGVALLGSGVGTLQNGALSLNLRNARMLAGFVYDGAVYMRSAQKADGQYRYFRIALDDAGDVDEVDCAGLGFPYVNDAYGGRIFCFAGGGVGSGTYGVVLNTAHNHMRRIEVYSGAANYLTIYPIRGRELLALANRDNGDGSSGVMLSVRGNYLATVNDLAEPVTKTAAQTMKVTYILRRTAGTTGEGNT